MKDFAGAASFVAFFEKLMLAMPVAQTVALDLAASLLEKEAKRVIGEGYDYPAPHDGPEPYDPRAPWQELAEYTKQDRAEQGYTEDEPLLRTGELRDSIQHNAGPFEAYVGFDSEIAEWQETGTYKIPPRPFLGGAAVRKGDEAVEAIKDVIVSHLIGRAVSHYKPDESDDHSL